MRERVQAQPSKPPVRYNVLSQSFKFAHNKSIQKCDGEDLGNGPGMVYSGVAQTLTAASSIPAESIHETDAGEPTCGAHIESPKVVLFTGPL